MASNMQRTVTLTLDAQTTGTDGVKGLANELHRLAQAGGDAAPEFSRLAKELDAALAAEGQQAEKLKASTAALAASKQALLEARAAVSAYQAAIGGAKNATTEQVAELARLNQAVRDSKAAVDGSRAAFAAATNEHERLAASTQRVTAGAEQMVKAVKAPGEAAEASAKKAEGAFSGLAEKLKGFAAPVLAAFGAAEFWKANTNLESLRRTLELMTGSSEAAAKEIEYLRTTANRLGIDVTSTPRPRRLSRSRNWKSNLRNLPRRRRQQKPTHRFLWSRPSGKNYRHPDN